jgi:hypothetical protein
MPKREIFAAADHIRNKLTEIVARRGERSERRLTVHADNARPYIAKSTRTLCDDNVLRIAPHPPYLSDSPDLSPSDCSLFSCFLVFLFGHLKTRLQGQQFRSAYELLSGVREILDEISIDMLEVVFQE